MVCHCRRHFRIAAHNDQALVAHNGLQLSHLAGPQTHKHQEHDLEVAEQHWLASIVVAARANGKPLALGSSRFLVLADVPYVENNTTRAIGTLVGTLVKR